MISYRRALSNVLGVVAAALLLLAIAIAHEAGNPLDCAAAVLVGLAGALLLYESYRVDEDLP